ncbi:hypothetical protein NPIL_160311 [Nephila pilipes]|uniref:Uncharacterized protein n=1 Tax=Nephila pilipes TaxID=299642 RepID=A0A8X6T8U1_NEPPI|nr:hypothetical protein NPIL_651391 [Nephila pilipes]GFT11021.1 hypothetical protein NPIL_392871 [Nephila pilipes]GFT19570.1 hypothetical protein NPIL_241291 [Nephila pilipes]GFT90195.1 hypothetical protein NPIL_160311 [Nephila pilipes]
MCRKLFKPEEMIIRLYFEATGQPKNHQGTFNTCHRKGFFSPTMKKERSETEYRKHELPETTAMVKLFSSELQLRRPKSLMKASGKKNLSSIDNQGEFLVVK